MASEHSCRLKDPEQYQNFGYGQCDRRDEDRCIGVVYGINGSYPEVQELRFSVDQWTELEALVYCEDAGGVFESAIDEEAEDETMIEQQEAQQPMRGQKQFVTQVKAADDSARSITFVMSSEARDRDGDIIRVDGWKTDSFMTNPVFLTFHDQRQFPIGRVEKIWSESGKLMGEVRFAAKGTYEIADIAYELYKQKIMNAVSVSFIGLEYDQMEDGGYEFKAQELIELSAVPVPANPEAVAVARKAGNLDAIFAPTDAKAQPEATPESELINHLAAQIKALGEHNG